MEPLDIAVRFAIALVLGVFLGLERERSSQPGKESAGVRTFGLIALAGALATYVQMELGLAWLAILVFASVAVLIIVAYAVTSRAGDVGITTEVAAILAFLVGAVCMSGKGSLAAGLAVVIGLLLAMRDPLHSLAKHIDREDVQATLKFAVVTLIVLPLLPDVNYGPAPLDVINPHKIWLMVVFISAVDFTSYVLVKVLGNDHGIAVTGVLGGLVSSTALTLNFARQSRTSPRTSAMFAVGILSAWSIMFARVLVITALLAVALAPRLGLHIVPPLIACVAGAAWMWKRGRSDGRNKVEMGPNPFELKQAVRFGLLFGGVSFAAKAAQVYLGDSGLYAAGAIAGSVDVDAITISMANLANAEPDKVGVAARTVAIAALSNTLVKSVLILVIGSPNLRRAMIPAILVVLAAGAAAAVFL